jgi:uncharacterized C2H2 Zn-finger protein
MLDLRNPVAPCGCGRDTAEMKPLRCLLHLHAWHTYHNHEGQRYLLCTRCGAYGERSTLIYMASSRTKPLTCLLHLHVWHTHHNDEGQRYLLCTRCGAYREKYTLTDYRAGPNS